MIKMAPTRFDCEAPRIEEDPDGEEALWEGGEYYEEAMSYTDPSDHEKRIKCFQAAEQLYLQAVERGNAIASLCLGYVYSYDRCEGRYWVDLMTLNTEEDYRRPYPREERAFECFSIEAEASLPIIMQFAKMEYQGYTVSSVWAVLPSRFNPPEEGLA